MALQLIHGETLISGNVQHQGEPGEPQINLIMRRLKLLQGLQFLHRVAATDAFHNSAERFPQPKCHPEIRTKMLGHLWNWTCGVEPPQNFQDEAGHSAHGHSIDQTTRILWLHGPAVN